MWDENEVVKRNWYFYVLAGLKKYKILTRKYLEFLIVYNWITLKLAQTGILLIYVSEDVII